MARTRRPPMTIGAWLRYDAIRRGLGALAPNRVLEIGPGLGAMAVRLAARYDYVAVEEDAVSATATAEALTAGSGRVYRGGIERVAGAPPFDAVCAFEVLEHQPDDVAELTRWAGLLADAGGVVLSVPAHEQRFGPWDRAVGHVRRYSRESLAATLDAAGFDVVAIEAWGVGLGDALEMMRHRLAGRLQQPGSPADRTAASGRILAPGLVRGMVNAVVAAPFRAIQYPLRRSRLGPGLVAVGRRRPADPQLP